MTAQTNTKRRRHSRIHRIVKSIRYFLGRRAIRIFFFIPHIIPFSWALSFSKILVNMVYHIPGIYRRQALTNLKLFFGKNKSYREIKDIARNVSMEATKGFFELAYAVSPRQEELYSSIEIEGIEHLDAALERGKGVIALSAHLGNFTIMGGKLVSEGYPFNMVLKLPHDRGISEFLKLRMEQYNHKFILADPTIESQKEIIRSLRRNEIVCLIADGDQKFGGIPVKLMGQEIAVPPGPAILAKRTGATILPMFIIRQPNDSHKIIIDPPVKVDGDESYNHGIVQLTIKLTRIIENYICQYPTQWYWVNKKHRYNRYRKKLKEGKFK